MFLLLSYKFEDYSWGCGCTLLHLVYGVLWLEPRTPCLLGKRQRLQPHRPYKMMMALLLSSAFSLCCHVTERVPRIPLGLVGEVLWVVRGEVANPASQAGQGHFLRH